MRHKLHPSGPEFSRLALGFWRLDEWDLSTKELEKLIEECLKIGITTFDHADIYGHYENESLFGNVLKKRPGLREKMELVTKCGICLPGEKHPGFTIQHYNTTAAHIRASVEQSLKNLCTDYLDLVLIHRPDPLMDAAEIADTFMKLTEEGKILHAGVSNFTPSQFDLLQSCMQAPLVTNQTECSLLHPGPVYDGTFDQAQKQNASPMIWSPFAGGELFAGKGERALRVQKECRRLAENYSATVDQIALAWLYMLPCNPLPVIGTGKIERITSAAGALSLKLDRQDWFRLLEASVGHSVP